MRLKALLIAIFAVAAFTSAAVASSQKPPKTGPGCKPMVTLIVVGEATFDATATQVSLDVTGGNRFARSLVKADVTGLMVTAGTKTQVVTASGEHIALTAVDKGDRVLVQYRVCKADVTGATATVAHVTTLLTQLSPKKIVELG